MSLTTLARNAGLGRLLLACYHRPVGAVRDSLRNGGPLAEWSTERQRREMESAAWELTTRTFPGPPIELHLMTGRRFWYQTAFCLHSFATAAHRSIHAHIYDDGTLTDDLTEALRRQTLQLTLHRHCDLQDRLNTVLPRERFPVLRDRWEKYPNIRKLIDVHAGSSGWKLVIDSDLLFFDAPDELLQWADEPKQPLVATDCTESYGYTRELMQALAGTPIPPLVNVGLCGLRSDELDWAELERWTAELQAREKTSYYLEQALVAMLVSRTPFTIVSPERYITKPSRAQVQTGAGVMQHYVAESKRWYFRDGWRHLKGAKD